MRWVAAVLVLGSSLLVGQVLGGVLRRRSPGAQGPRAVARSDSIERALRAADGGDEAALQAAVAALDDAERQTRWGRLLVALAADDVAALDALATAAPGSPEGARAVIEALERTESGSKRDIARRTRFAKSWPASWWQAQADRRHPPGDMPPFDAPR